MRQGQICFGGAPAPRHGLEIDRHAFVVLGHFFGGHFHAELAQQIGKHKAQMRRRHHALVLFDLAIAHDQIGRQRRQVRNH